jgi:hypothetical protein
VIDGLREIVSKQLNALELKGDGFPPVTFETLLLAHDESYLHTIQTKLPKYSNIKKNSFV